MGYLCLNCFEEYDKSLLKAKENNVFYCPNKKCEGFSLIEVDDLIVPIIKLLNIKGYKTYYCCSSHSYENKKKPNTYILFDEECFPIVIPKDFIIECDEYYKEYYGCDKPDNKVCIRKWYGEELNEYELHKEICKTMIDLMEWVEELLYRDKFEKDEQCDLRQEYEI